MPFSSLHMAAQLSWCQLDLWSYPQMLGQQEASYLYVDRNGAVVIAKIRGNCIKDNRRAQKKNT